MKHLVESDPDVMMGKPVIAGTRVTVESILERIAAGESIDDIAGSHPRVSTEAVRGAVAYAAEAMGREVIYSVPDEAA